MTSSDERPRWVVEYERLEAEDLRGSAHRERAEAWRRLGRLLGTVGIAVCALVGLVITIGFFVVMWLIGQIF